MTGVSESAQLEYYFLFSVSEQIFVVTLRTGNVPSTKDTLFEISALRSLVIPGLLMLMLFREHLVS